MKAKFQMLILATALLGLSLACTQQKEADIPSSNLQIAAVESPESVINRGEYLTKVIGCDHCHSPKKMTAQGPVIDIDKYMMGYPADRPLPEYDAANVAPGKWVLMNGDLTAAVGPWGITYASNLTPDPTGIGNWTFENFKLALTQGKYKGIESGRTIMPPMPWQSLGKMDETDMKAIFAYLKSLKPIENQVPAYTPPMAMN
ncbi:diheme cytochrome c-553 [Cryomorpha ignava]|uniref:Diheme cytochrome c-553 n=1 Tax=Cryomorpha ignava TaxID=101383 RepID=A0A7K3WQG1_9FLAO|nr:diheme cytochrome c-553 [Cryomorpha ignava]NEN23897.1 diheme cytochrome c-553 [Cryomorpha ignava]